MTTLFTLPNGIRCVHEPRPGGRQVIFHVAIHTGSNNEKPGENGLNFLAQEAVNGGTKTLSREDLVDIIENRAAGLNTIANRDETHFGIRCLKEDAEFLFPVLADVILNPAYAPEEVEWTKVQIENWIKKKQQDPSQATAQLFSQTAFSGQAAGLPHMGTPESLKSFTVEQVKAKHAEMIGDTSDIVISIGGDIDLETAKSLAERHFGHIQPGPARPRPSLTFTPGDGRITRDSKHLNLVFGFEAPGLHNPERTRYLLLRELLSGGMSSPLFQEIREKRSLVYGIGAGYSPKEDSGIFTISAGTSGKNARMLIEETLNLFGHFAREGFTREEIEKAKASIMRSFQSQDEVLASVVETNASQMLSRNRVVSNAETKARLDAITSDDLRHACADLMREGRYVLSGIGPQEAMPSPDEIKAMMARQLDGLTLPPKRPATDPLTASFQDAAQGGGEVTLPKPQLTVLENGMKVITVERPGMLSTGIWVGVGSGHEAPELSGATHMMEHMMFKGTPSYPGGTIDSIVEKEFAADLNANTSQSRTAYFFMNLLPEHLEKSVSMLGEMVFDANIGKTEYEGGEVTNARGETETIAGERAVVLEEIGQYDGKVWARQGNLQSKICYPGQALGWPILGTPESLMGISAEDLRVFRDLYYVPNNTVFVAAGPVRHEDVVAAVKAKLGHKTPGPVPVPEKPVFHGGVGIEEMATAQLSTVEISFEGVGSNHAEAGAYDLLATVLGTGHSSRLYREVVEKRRLATSMNADAMMLPESGMFSMHTECEAENIRDIVKASYETLARVAYGTGPGEIEKVRKMAKTSLVARLETNHNICNWFGNNVIAAGKMMTPEDEFAQIEAVTDEDIRRVALRLMNSVPALTSILVKGTDHALVPTHQELLAIRDSARMMLMGAPAAPQPQTADPAPAI